MILVSHPTGNAFLRALLIGCLERGKLDSFHTTLSTGSLERIPPGKLIARRLRRHFPVPVDKTVTSPWLEIVRLTAPRLGLSMLTEHERGWASTDAVYRHLDGLVGRHIEKRFAASRKENDGLSAVYAYEDGALSTFRAARRNGLLCVYDLPIAHWQTSRSLLEREARRWPEWEPTLVGTRDSQEKLERKSEELSLADIVVVPSQFVFDSLPEEARHKSVVAEFGSPESQIDEKEPVPKERNPRLRVLFAGSMSQRKGLADLFQAMKLVDRRDVELVVMGSPVAPMSFYRSQYADFTYEPPRPHGQVLELMRSCDVLVLPSIVEGRALVQQEAMICGLPLIATANAGGEDLIDNGETGFLVPAGAPESLAERISWFADHRSRIEEMGRLARDKARQVTWDSYRSKILDAVFPPDASLNTSSQHEAMRGQDR